MSDDPTEQLRILTALRADPEILSRIAAADLSGLHLQNQLRKEFTAEIVRAGLSLHELRHRARTKFEHAGQMWFDRVGLEQATGDIVARHKAQRFSSDVVDLCCGIGGDAIAMAAECQVTAVDRSPVRCAMVEWNAEAYDIHSNVKAEKAFAEDIDIGGRLVHIDPDRRNPSGLRSLRVEHGQPGLEFLQALTRTRGGAIKLSPASNFGGKFPNAEVELISVGGECREATVWFGELRREHEFTATVLSMAEGRAERPTCYSISGNPLDAWAPVAAPRRYVYDPDPSIVRAGLVDVLCEQTKLERLDEAEEYLTSESLVETAFAAAFEVVEALPYDPKAIRRYFLEHEWSDVEIKCRHIAVSADKIRRKLSFTGDTRASLIIARTTEGTRAIVCRRVSRGS